MSKTPSKADTQEKPDEASTAAAVTVADEISLVEFCTRLSATVRRPELISAFEFSERRSGSIKDTAEAFQARFETFGKKPV